jgi:hypothetical protein
MGFLSTFFLIIGIGLLAFLIAIIIFQIIMLVLAVWLVKKHPFISLIIFLFLIVIATVQIFDPATIIFGVTELVIAITFLAINSKRMIQAILQ